MWLFLVPQSHLKSKEMRLLFCCEFYHPSRGGVQEVMRQIAERMVARGHQVTVATSRLPERDFKEFNGVHIEEFDVSGNLASGLKGDVARYQHFLANADVDAIMIKAAQQWTFDACWPVLDSIRARKVFIPCGFAGFYLPAFEQYFRDLPPILAKFDQLIFYSETYRDIDFARKNGLDRLTILPNGASEIEFSVTPDPSFRARHGIGDDELILMTVGTPTTAKGHNEVAAAFEKVALGEHVATLFLNGAYAARVRPRSVIGRSADFARRAARTILQDGPGAFVRRAGLSLAYRSAKMRDRLRARPSASARTATGSLPTLRTMSGFRRYRRHTASFAPTCHARSSYSCI